MATASSSKPVRKSCLKRRSVYDDFGSVGSSGPSRPDGIKKQRQSTLPVQSSQQQKNKEEIKKPGPPKIDLTSTHEADQSKGSMAVSDPGKSGQPDIIQLHEAYVILVHTFNPESISEVTVGQAFHSLEKANEGVANLFRRVKPEFVDIVIDIGVANEFDEGGDTYPDVRRRVTSSGRAAYLWHTEEGRGELNVHRILIE
ncbi:hypothetical protein M409DRAFT_30465 [Zasmidium cellare ATCC 36951]|uniref:Uncharacterized protein n=1 Tax=Zasmidium cellare ATCC 36951 TaxID=1080233 RepID=A0A6A6BWH7_ZASCE|nr:uncharacterized protein M409DRAFT_30465 [Zasmidium cellare ATCC 36951]KAF2159045.1 hypothetical protein M409DRAFT_30465 [Zasmidium cellare ATCC 36951]